MQMANTIKVLQTGEKRFRRLNQCFIAGKRFPFGISQNWSQPKTRKMDIGTARR